MKKPKLLTVVMLAAIAFLTYVNVHQATVIQKQRVLIVVMYKDLVTSLELLQRCAGDNPDNTVLRAQR